MTITTDKFNWRLAALFVVLFGAAALQVVAAVGTGNEDVQLVVIGTASIVMLLAIGVVMWLVRGLQHGDRQGPDGREAASGGDRQQ